MRIVLLLLFCTSPLLADFTVDTATVVAETLTGDGDGATGLITDSGSITVAADGVTMGGDAGDANQTVTNNGTITVTGGGSDGISNGANGTGATITNNSTITGVDAGIQSSGANTTITNTGTITGNFGIFNTANGANTTITNGGTITAAIVGIANNGDNITITNSGTIFAPSGITNDGENITITNTGTITSTGGDGILIAGDNTTVTNFGTISSTGGGADSNGIDQAVSNNLTVINSGTISSLNGDAIEYTGTNPTLILKRPSNLQGTMHSTNALNVTVEEGLNLRLALDADSNGFAALNVDDPFVVSNGVLATVDRTGFAMQTAILEDFSDAILGNIYKSRDPFFNCCFPCFSIWGEAIGSERKSRRNINFRNNQIGALGGVSFALCDHGALGIFGGYSDERSKVEDSTQSAQVRNYLGGVSYEHLCKGIFYGGALAFGGIDWHNKRRVMDNLAGNGISTARADIDGWSFLADINATGQLKPLGFIYEPRVSLALNYAGFYLGDYSESGTTANISLNSRNIGILKLRAEFGAAHFLDPYFKTLNIEPYIGAAGRFQVQGNTVDSVLLGVDLNFDSGAKTYLAEGLLGIRGELTCWCLSATFNIEGMIDSANSSRILGEAGVICRF